MRQIRRRDRLLQLRKSPRVTCENHRRYGRILSLRFVARIQTGLNSCDISQRQTKSKQLVAAAVQTRRHVAAICRILCIGLKNTRVQSRLFLILSQRALHTRLKQPL